MIRKLPFFNNLKTDYELPQEFNITAESFMAWTGIVITVSGILKSFQGLPMAADIIEHINFDISRKYGFRKHVGDRILIEGKNEVRELRKFEVSIDKENPNGLVLKPVWEVIK